VRGWAFKRNHALDNDGKIWAQRNVSDYDIIGDLEAAGAPKSDIVLAFHTSELRRFTEYAEG
jgi:hypothetical protein